MNVIQKSIVKAIIDEKVVIVELASERVDAYKDMADKIVYLGKGVYYSVDDVLQCGRTPTHFWKFKQSNP